jgi:hypothetical protein
MAFFLNVIFSSICQVAPSDYKNKIQSSFLINTSLSGKQIAVFDLQIEFFETKSRIFISFLEVSFVSDS